MEGYIFSQKKKEEIYVPIFGDQDMEEGRHVNFTEFCPSTLSRASTKWHERLGKSDLVKIL